jgi:hypothetical protein
VSGASKTFETMTIITLLSALFISSVAAWFSIAGLTAIFPGASVSVGIMGVALEIGKLVAATWLHRFWKKTNFLLKIYFISAVIILSFITSIGIFGYLTRAYIEGTQNLNANADQIALLDNEIEIEREHITSLRQALQQMDAAINNLITENRVERAVQIRNTQRRERQLVNDGITEANVKITNLQKQKSELNIGQRNLETEIGPIKYVAQLVYETDDAETIGKSVRLLILVLIFVFDPLAILMVIAANISFKHRENFDNEISLKKSIDTQENTTTMNNDWSPENWFKIVKKPL